MHRLLAIILLCLSCGCTFDISRKYLPSPISNDTFNDPVKSVAIPLPVIASSPNEGVTAGALVTLLLHNAKDEVTTLGVVQENYNKYFGITSTLYGAFYLTPDAESLKVVLSKATTINQEFRVRYDNERFLDLHNFFFTAFDSADGSTRFFGFESNSSKSNETNYTDHEIGFTSYFGYRFQKNLKLIFGERFKQVYIEQGAVKSLPFITDVFSPESVPGVDGYPVHAQKVALQYDSLYPISIPTDGTFLSASVENSFEWLGSFSTFQVVNFEVKKYFPMEEGKFITVARLSCNQALGENVPFLEQSILGGENTLRGYGQNRFVDKAYLLINLEERIRLFRWKIFGVNADWEIAPFVDMGAVMRSLVDLKGAGYKINPGLGLRAVVRPNIVGRIDVGLGNEGPAVFVGLNYPF